METQNYIVKTKIGQRYGSLIYEIYFKLPPKNGDLNRFISTCNSLSESLIIMQEYENNPEMIKELNRRK